MYDQRILDQIREKIEAAERIAIFSHIRPDGDALGSLFGLGRALLNAGKSVQLISSDPLPKEGWLADSGSVLVAEVGATPMRTVALAWAPKRS